MNSVFPNVATLMYYTKRIRACQSLFCYYLANSSSSGKCNSFNISPFGGAVGPAAQRSFFSKIRSSICGGYFPLPTSISVPAIMRTILYRKPFPVIRIIISTPSLITCISKIVRTVVVAVVFMLQKLLKSCVPTR